MSKTPLLLTVSAVSILTGLHFASGDAFAQKGQLSSPRTQWAITQVDGQPGKDNGYCAAARRFDTNAILTFARNEHDENSLAIDFQSPRLPHSGAVAVTLDPGAGEQRKDQVTPVSRNAFVVKLGRDDAFMDALEHTGQLRVEVAGDAYVFDVADIDAGKIQLSSCLAQLDNADGGVLTETAAVQKLRQDVAALRNENRVMRDAAAMEVVKPSVKPAASKKIAKKVEKLRAEVAGLEEKNKVLLEQAASLESGGFSDAQKVSLVELRSENAVLQGQIDELSQAAGDGEVLVKQLSKLERENDALHAELEMAYAETARATDGDAKALKRENAQMKAALERAEHSKVALRDVRDKLARVERENTALKDAGMDAVSSEEAQRLEGVIASLREKNLLKSQELAELAQLRVELDNLRVQKGALEQQLAQAEVGQETLDNLQLYATTLEKDNAQLLSNNKALKVAKAENSKFKIKVSKLESEVAEYRERNNTIMAKAENKLRDFHGEIKRANEATEQLREEKMQLAAKLAGENADHVALIEKLRAENEKLELAAAGQDEATVAELAALQGKNAELAGMLESQAAENEKALAALEAGQSEKIAALRDENAQLSQELTAQLDVLRAENVELAQVLEARDAEGADRDGVMASLREENAALSGEMKTQAASYDSTVASLHLELAELAEMLDGDAEQYMAEIAALREENVALSAEFEMQLAALNDEKQALVAQISGADAVAAGLAAEKIALAEKLEAENAKNSELVEALKHENLTLAMQLEEQSTKNTTLIAALEVENKGLVGQLEAGVGVNKDQLEALKFENLALVTKLEAQNVENETLIAQLQSENVSLSEQMATKNTEHEAVIAALKVESEAAVEVLRAENAALAEQNVVLAQKFDGDAQQGALIIETLRRENVELAGLVESQSAESAEKGAVIGQLKEENVALSSELKAQMSHAENGVAQLAALEAENAKLQTALIGAQVQITAMAEDLKAKDVVLAQAEMGKAALQGELDAFVTAALDEKPASEPNIAAQLAAMEPAAGAASVAADEIVVVEAGASPKKIVDSVVMAVASMRKPTPPARKANKGVIRAVAGEVAKGAKALRRAASRGSVVLVADDGAQQFMNQNMSQAQIHEEQMRRAVENREALIQGAVLDTADKVEPALNAVIDRVTEGTPKGEAVEMRMSQDPFAEIEVAAPDEVVGTVKAVEDATEETVAVVEAMDEEAAQSAVSSAVGNVLALANIRIDGVLQPVPEASKGGVMAYQWRADNVYGSSEEAPLSASVGFDARVKDYLVKTQSRCPGDFAIVPEDSRQAGAMRVDSYEVACMGGGAASAASLVFYNMDGVFTVVAHEVPAEDMEAAMKMRDRIFATLVDGADS
ncbi:MAG: hypothetical protein ACRBCT_09510 [Alphaproteobacteria bacterium]